MEDFNSQDSQEIMKNFKSIVGSRLEKLYNEKGSDGELYAYSIAVANQKKKKAKETPQDTTMENSRLREMVIDALTEKKKSFPDLTGDNKVTKADILKARGVEFLSAPPHAYYQAIPERLGVHMDMMKEDLKVLQSLSIMIDADEEDD